MIKALHINLLGGCGVGKSTTATGLFSKLKRENFKVEYVPEYAKDLTYSEEYNRLRDQLHILGEQHHRVYRVRDKVDYIIQDSPLIIGLLYVQDDGILPVATFKKLVLELFNNYNNLNIVLTRNLNKEYQQYGRSQSLDEAIALDKQLIDLLKTYQIPFIEIEANQDDTIENIYSKVNEIKMLKEEKC